MVVAGFALEFHDLCPLLQQLPAIEDVGIAAAILVSLLHQELVQQQTVLSVGPLLLHHLLLLHPSSVGPERVVREVAADILPGGGQDGPRAPAVVGGRGAGGREGGVVEGGVWGQGGGDLVAVELEYT